MRAGKRWDQWSPGECRWGEGGNRRHGEGDNKRRNAAVEEKTGKGVAVAGSGDGDGRSAAIHWRTTL